jgi:hypothetical protein
MHAQGTPRKLLVPLAIVVVAAVAPGIQQLTTGSRDVRALESADDPATYVHAGVRLLEGDPAERFLEESTPAARLRYHLAVGFELADLLARKRGRKLERLEEEERRLLLELRETAHASPRTWRRALAEARDPKVRRRAAVLAGGDDRAASLDALARAFDDGDVEVARAAYASAIRLSAPDTTAVHVRALSVRSLRRQAIVWLDAYPDPRAVPALERLLESGAASPTEAQVIQDIIRRVTETDGGPLPPG